MPLKAFVMPLPCMVRTLCLPRYQNVNWMEKVSDAHLQGDESQVQSHMAIRMNVGITAGLLTQLLTDRVDAEPARRSREALACQLAAESK